MKYLVALLLLLPVQALAGPRLYIFDCGLIKLESLDMFNLRQEESSVRELFVPCYLVEHSQGRLFFDGGLPKNVADSADPVSIEGASLVYQRWVLDQLSDMGLQPGDIDYVAYSHLHFDHAGTASYLLAPEVLMQRKEWDAVFTGENSFVDPALVAGLQDARVRFIDGDHDVFGDGSVQLVFTPGHTPGHQLLSVKLDDTGHLFISGDLYHTRANRDLRRVPTFNADAGQTHESMDRVETLLRETGATLWIEHDKVLADSLKKAPHYYD